MLLCLLSGYHDGMSSATGQWKSLTSISWVQRLYRLGCVQSVCHEVRVEREKSILKQGAVQHLYGRLAGTLRADAGDAALLVRPSP